MMIIQGIIFAAPAFRYCNIHLFKSVFIHEDLQNYQIFLVCNL